jgi:hypothetical protein
MTSRQDTGEPSVSPVSIDLRAGKYPRMATAEEAPWN